MTAYKIKIEKPITFQHFEIKFPMYFKRNDFEYFKFCSSSQYICVASYGKTLKMSYFEEADSDIEEMIIDLLKNKECIQIEKEEFNGTFDSSEKYIRRKRDYDYWDEQNKIK